MVSDADREAFQRSIWPHAAAVLRTARLMLRDTASADDLAQETMLKAVRFVGRFEEGTDAKAWLMTILRRTRLDMLRKARREPAIRLDDVDPQAAKRDAAVASGPAMTPAEADELLNSFSDETMIEALRSLPEEIRWTLLLVDVEGHDHRTAAKILDVPEGTIKSRAHRGRAMLRTALRPVAFRERCEGEDGRGSTPMRSL